MKLIKKSKRWCMTFLFPFARALLYWQSLITAIMSKSKNWLTFILAQIKDMANIWLFVLAK